MGLTMMDAEDIHEVYYEDGHANPDLSFPLTKEMVEVFFSGKDRDQLIEQLVTVLGDPTEAEYMAEDIKLNAYDMEMDGSRV